MREICFVDPCFYGTLIKCYAKSFKKLIEISSKTYVCKKKKKQLKYPQIGYIQNVFFPLN